MTSRIVIHPSAQLVWAIATREASMGGKAEVEPVHFLLGVLHVLDDLFQQTADGLDVPPDAFSSLPDLITEGRRALALDSDALTRLRRKIRVDLRPGGADQPVRMLHRSPAARQLFDRAIRDALRENATSLTMLHLLRSLLAEPPADVAPYLASPPLAETVDVKPPAIGTAADLPKGADARPRTPTLDRMGRDLTRLAAQGRLATISGREEEMKLLARYLNRTTKRNVLIHGDAGVGKTALVEGLAQRLVREDAPDFLRRLRIVQVNVGDLVAKTKFRGEMEARVQALLSEVSSDPSLVLFLDEIHLAMGAGAAGDAPMDVANLLKPMLARDDFRCIGATTTDEFERHIKPDAAFLRRFQVLRLEEPSEVEALEVARRWAARIESVQGVKFEEDALRAAVALSARLIQGRALPDKAIDLLENAAVFVKVGTLSGRALAPDKRAPRVGRAEIAAVLEEQYGVAVSGSEVLDPTVAGTALRDRLIGQEAAIAALVETIDTLARRDAGSRPLGVLLLSGSTGIGKTQAAEILAERLFAGALCRLNMNEFKERHELSRLVGAAPGLVGHGEAGALFRFREAHPQGVILLDEMEKAHPEIQDFFLQIFDKGEARDGRGRPGDFRRHLFILTCNAASEAVVAGFRPGSAPADEGLREHFRPEFLGRVDRVIRFRDLGPPDFRALLDRRLAALSQELEPQGIRLETEDRAREALVRSCSTSGSGARGFLREFERRVRAPVFSKARELGTGVLRVDWGQDGLALGGGP